ncbi:hypothetical protein Fcan01_08690 [Folsomia candida]|uniref:Uncharacterized protein n=1 Tax=Folsomia candida TaxID=158441 RepID=A0A226EEZ0_FOLCA|nr:hypothetical protein Fcan01_08690 [Folsomia candida]
MAPRRHHSAVGFLLLFLTAMHVGKVSPQLYTYLEDVAAVWDLPLENINPSHKDYRKDGLDLQTIINEIRYVTCLAKIPRDWNDQPPEQVAIEFWDYFRNRHDSNFIISAQTSPIRGFHT